jgi:hypothetical protein
MEKIDDGGPAFPGDAIGRRGMSLRDWLAGKAMEGMLACSKTTGSKKDIAYDAYSQADAMIAESKKGK